MQSFITIKTRPANTSAPIQPTHKRISPGSSMGYNTSHKIIKVRGHLPDRLKAANIKIVEKPIVHPRGKRRKNTARAATFKYHVTVDDKSTRQVGSGRITGDPANTNIYKARTGTSLAHRISRQAPVRAHFLVPRRTKRCVTRQETHGLAC